MATSENEFAGKTDDGFIGNCELTCSRPADFCQRETNHSLLSTENLFDSRDFYRDKIFDSRVVDASVKY